MEGIKEGTGIGLVLEGGALRGLFTAGVIDVMMEHALWPDGLIGVSAGAAFGCNMKSRQPGRVIRYNKRFAKDWRYCSAWSLLTTGNLFGAKFGYHTLPDKLDPFDTQAFDENPMAFYAVCTDVETGKAVYKRLDHCSYETNEWIRASASMPVAAKIVTIQGQKLLDGGIADSIPLEYFQSIGYQRNVVVLTQPRDFVKKDTPMNPLINLWLRRYPNFTAASDHRAVMYNAELDYVREQERLGNTLVIAPKEKLPINHISHDPEQMQQVYDLGRQAAEERLDKLRAFFGL